MAECAFAAKEIGLSDLTVANDRQNGVSYDPPYCYFEGRQLKFNSGSNKGACSNSDQCLCIDDPNPPRLLSTQLPSKYVLKKSGECTRITTEAECTIAAKALGLRDTSVTDDKQRGVNYDPPYCYLEGGSLKFNKGKNYGPCTNADQCLCKNEQVQAPYKMVRSGTSCKRITTKTECEVASRRLGLQGYTAVDDNQKKVSHDPPYCYLEGGQLKFNADGSNSGRCSSADVCLCKN